MKNNIIQSRSTDINQHYQHLSEHYDDIVFCDETYRQWGTGLIVQTLEITPFDFVVDLGGGTGIYSQMIYATANLNINVLCVDLCDEMLQKARHFPGVSTLCADALSFAQNEDIRYDKLFIKESIHHFSQRTELFKGIYQQLTPDGRLLVTTRPQIPELPFFTAAMKSFAQMQPHYDVLKTEIETAGFDIDVRFQSYSFKFKKEHWFYMLRQCFMSNLTTFSEEQIEQGIAELNEKYLGQDNFEFYDRVIFLVGDKRGK